MTVGIGRSAFKEKGHVARIGRPDAEVQRPDNMTKASGRPMFSAVRSPTALFRGGLLFKPHGWLKLTLLIIFIDIATL